MLFDAVFCQLQLVLQCPFWSADFFCAATTCLPASLSCGTLSKF